MEMKSCCYERTLMKALYNFCGYTFPYFINYEFAHCMEIECHHLLSDMNFKILYHEGIILRQEFICFIV